MIREGFDAKKYIDQVATWLYGVVKRAGCSGVVVGLSGGIDSSVVAGICRKAFPGSSNPMGSPLGVIMPCHSNPMDAVHGKMVASTFKMPCIVVDLSKTYDVLMTTLGLAYEQKIYSMMRANIKSRLRMVTLYTQANAEGSMVVGTSNADEMYVGYFTKFGDGGCDVEPLAELTKDEVRACARELGVPEEIISKPPSSGLWDGQTDEEEMGFTYDDLDRVVLHKAGYFHDGKYPVSADVLKYIYKMHDSSEHKRALPPAPEFLKSS